MFEGILKCLLGRTIVIGTLVIIICSSLFLHAFPPLLKLSEQLPTFPPNRMMVLFRSQPHIGHPRLVEGVGIAARPGIVLGARHHVEDGRPGGGPAIIVIVLLVVIIVVLVRMEPPDGAALVQPVHAQPDRVGQLGTITSAPCAFVGIGIGIGICVAVTTDEGNHGIEQAARGGIGDDAVVVTAAHGAAAHGSIDLRSI